MCRLGNREESCFLLFRTCFLQPSRGAGPKNNFKSGPRLVMGGCIFETRGLSLFDLQMWALETVSGLLAGR